MTLVEGPPRICRLQRKQVQPWLQQLTDWLLPEAAYAIEHTWPQLYRSDGNGAFLGMFVDDRLVSHLAWRGVTLHGERSPHRAALLGSVATAPELRGRGYASQLLQQAIADCRDQGIDTILLWAEQPELYARAGFRAGEAETCLLLARRPHADVRGIRVATVADHGQLHALHEQKPLRVERPAREMSALLTTPGLTTTVLCPGERILAYACCGKGADLQGWWHECGGSDTDVARLLAGSMHLLGQTEAPLIVPPYRQGLADGLGASAQDEFTVAGPMQLQLSASAAQRTFVDGLDSV
jgi:GNAT superfamily N-acetyltransferase